MTTPTDIPSSLRAEASRLTATVVHMGAAECDATAALLVQAAEEVERLRDNAAYAEKLRLAMRDDAERLRAMLAPVQEAARKYKAARDAGKGRRTVQQFVEVLEGLQMSIANAGIATIADEK